MLPGRTKINHFRVMSSEPKDDRAGETTKFDVTPEVARRELRFEPSDAGKAERLSAAQIALYNERGFVAPLPCLSRAEVDSVRSFFDALLAQVQLAGGDSYSISTAHLKHGRVYDLLRHPTIVAYVRDILGSDVIGWGSHFFCKLPGDGKCVAWHQDAGYWPLYPARTVTVWLAVDRTDRGNSCMQVIPGSHRHGSIPYRESAESENNVLNQTVDGAERYGHPVDLELEAGWLSLHSDLLLHGSPPNDSHRRRCGLTLRYCSADVRAELDWHHKGVVVAGEDSTGHWANPARPRK